MYGKDQDFRYDCLLTPELGLARVSLPDFHFPSFASGSQKIGDFLGVALQVQQHEVLFGRVAALQCAVLFAALKRTNLQNYGSSVS